MDRINLAQRRFSQIRLDPNSPVVGRGASEINVWLRDDVIHAIAEFIDHPDFQAKATWPLRRLIAGSGSDERRAVDAVDNALVAAALALLQLISITSVNEALIASNPPREEVVPAQVVIHGNAPPKSTCTYFIFNHLDVLLNQSTLISKRNWTDLVNPLDYFHPHGGMMSRTGPPKGITEAEFIVSFNPELHPVGDFVSRCMMRRIEMFRTCLSDFRRLVYAAWQQVGGRQSTLVDAEQLAWQDLQTRVEELDVLCLKSREAALRDSCVILTQVYGAFHPRPDLSWLDLPRNLLESDRAFLRHQIPNFRTSEPLERIAAALSDLRQLDQFSAGSNRRAEQDAAIAAGGLVLIDQPHQAYWQCRLLEVDWDRSPANWEFLRLLANKAKVGAAVREADLYGEPKARSTMANRFQRLKQSLPPTLWRLMVPAGTRAYRLNLKRPLVHLFDAE